MFKFKFNWLSLSQIRRSIVAFVFLVLCLLHFFGCCAAYDVTDLMSTVERLNLTKLANELKKRGLTDHLKQNYTIFAPTNDAFDKLTIGVTDFMFDIYGY